jgi:hypothetical protein
MCTCGSLPPKDAAFGSDAVADADPEDGAITTARAEHYFQTYIYARWNMTPARKAAIDKEHTLGEVVVLYFCATRTRPSSQSRTSPPPPHAMWYNEGLRGV